jgi:hypothetical protein
MKVLNLRCSSGHGFEGWFASEGDFLDQTARGLVTCPLCADATVSRLPSAPRLNLSGARAPAEEASSAAAGKATPPELTQAPKVPEGPAPAQLMQAMWMHAVHEVMARTEDVGERFAEEARKIHYGEIESRGIRGQATPEEREALSDEGIEVLSLPVPKGLKGPAH